MLTCANFAFFVLLHVAVAGKKYMFTLYESSPVYEFSNMGSLRMMFYEIVPSTEAFHWCFRSWNRQRSSRCLTRETVVYLHPSSIPLALYQGNETYPEYISRPYAELTHATFLTNDSMSCLDVDNPVYGTWFAVAYLMELQEDAPITIPINGADCSYSIQANATSVQLSSVVDVAVEVPLSVSLPPGLSHFRYFIGSTMQMYVVTLNSSAEYSVKMSARGAGLPFNHTSANGSHQAALDCGYRSEYCEMEYRSPVVNSWHYLALSNELNETSVVSLRVLTTVGEPVRQCENITLCAAGSDRHLLDEFPVNVTALDDVTATSAMTTVSTPSAAGFTSYTNLTSTDRPVTVPERDASSGNVAVMLREEDPSVAFNAEFHLFYIVDDTDVYMSRFDVDTMKDTGGTLRVSVKFRQYPHNGSAFGQTISVKVCIQRGSMPSADNSELRCSTTSSTSDELTADSASLRRYFLYPQPGHWFVVFQANCSNATAGHVEKCNSLIGLSLNVGITSCVDDKCENSGQCRAYTKGVYSYTACNCIAGYRGYSCEDDSEAASESMQKLYTALLTLSNLGFIPAVIIALWRWYFVEAVVYLANMIFSLLYHWCDMSTWSKYRKCVAPYSALQFCDFLCSLLSFWVTLLAVAKMNRQLRFTLFIAGLLAVMMPLQINSTGAITNAVPIVVGVSVVLISWMRVCYRTKHCYPAKHRWLWLCPGVVLAVVGIGIFAFAETESNYPYTHSAWHLCMSFSIVFLLPDKKQKLKDGVSSDASSYELEPPSLMRFTATDTAAVGQVDASEACVQASACVGDVDELLPGDEPTSSCTKRHNDPSVCANDLVALTGDDAAARQRILGCLDVAHDASASTTIQRSSSRTSLIPANI